MSHPTDVIFFPLHTGYPISIPSLPQLEVTYSLFLVGSLKIIEP